MLRFIWGRIEKMVVFYFLSEMMYNINDLETLGIEFLRKWEFNPKMLVAITKVLLSRLEALVEHFLIDAITLCMITIFDNRFVYI